MKSERRHQLQANELARQLETFPEKLKRHATSIMLGITVVVVVFVFVRYRKQAAALRDSSLSNALATARHLPPNFMLLEEQLGNMPSSDIARQRASIITQTNTAIDTILREADGDQVEAMKAEALIARGDLNWYLANLHPLPGATTQPALMLPRQRDEYLNAAEGAYGDVIAGYSSQLMAWTTAKFGLAAIAENRSDLASARRLYGEILANKDVADAFQAEAQLRLSYMTQIEKPMLIGTYPVSGSTTQPSIPSMISAPAPMYNPAKGESPTTQPANPSTSQPATQPAS